MQRGRGGEGQQGEAGGEAGGEGMTVIRGDSEGGARECFAMEW